MNINYLGRFGNNLFQYFTACILSKKFNLFIENPLDTKISKFKNIGTFKSEKKIEITDENIESILDLKTIDFDIYLNGFFQNKKIISYFLFYKNILFNSFGEINNTFVHVRLGDLYESYSGNGDRFLNKAFYEKALFGTEKGFISSDSINDNLVNYLSLKFNLEKFEKSPEETIIYGSKFSNKILSLGTFSWWIGFLGNQNRVICPNQSKYPKWHGDIFPILKWEEI